MQRSISAESAADQSSVLTTTPESSPLHEYIFATGPAGMVGRRLFDEPIYAAVPYDPTLMLRRRIDAVPVAELNAAVEQLTQALDKFYSVKLDAETLHLQRHVQAMVIIRDNWVRRRELWQKELSAAERRLQPTLATSAAGVAAKATVGDE